MCLAIPGKILNIYLQDDLLMGKVDFGGVTRETCLAYVPEAKVGDYTVVHVGFALSLIDEKEALETIELIEQIGSFDQGAGTEGEDDVDKLRAAGGVE
jgi:hydrogenase expression/formation protein HypC